MNFATTEFWEKLNNYKEARSMDMRNLALYVCVVMVFAVVGCSKPSKQVGELRRFPVDNLEGLITQSGVQIDKEISSDGNGSLRITATESTVVRLFEIGDIALKMHV